LSKAVTKYIRQRVCNWGIHARHDQQDREGHRVWAIVRYPKDEYDRLVRRLSEGEALYTQALQHAADGEWDSAIENLRRIMAEYPLNQQPIFETGKVCLRLADCLMQKQLYGKALAEYGRLMDLGRDSSYYMEARAGYVKAEELYDPLRDDLRYLAGKTFACVFVEQEDHVTRIVDTTEELASQLSGYGLRDVTRSVPQEVFGQGPPPKKSVAEAANLAIYCVFFLGEPQLRDTRWQGVQLHSYPVDCQMWIWCPHALQTQDWHREAIPMQASVRTPRRSAALKVAASNICPHVLSRLQEWGRRKQRGGGTDKGPD
ncbi:tol-pal system YbgF family protein, partial [Verrucomicrobiota bacterium]